MTSRILFFLLIALIPGTAAAQLDEAEREMVEYIDDHQAEALRLLEEVVNVNSGTMNFEGVRAVGRIFQEEFDALGFETRWADGAGWGRAGHLIAERDGSGPRMVLIGHLDTVFERDSPFQSFELIDDSTARGPGIVDMKGGIVVIVEAMKALRSAGLLDRVNASIVLIGDEEKSGRPLSEARRHLIEAAREADVALGFENGDGDPRTAVIARRGWTGWTLEVQGTPAHSSQIFQGDVGAGAVFEAARVLTEFYEELSGETNLTFNPAIALGGTEVEFVPEEDRGTASGKINVVAEHALVPGDLRALSMEQREAAKNRMREITARSLPQTRSEITFDDSYPPMAPTEGNRRLLDMYDRASRDLGFGRVEAVNPRNAGAADVSFTAEHVEMAIDGIGLMGSMGHTTEETADLRTLPSQTKRAALLIYRLMHSGTGARSETTGSADGVPIHYTRSGSGSPAILFVHGWTLNRGYWEAQLDHFGRSYEVAAVDLAGHGTSGRSRQQWTMERFGDDVAAVADRLQADSVVLVGHSMGGTVVLDAARKLGDRVAGIVLVDAFHDPDQRMPDDEREAILQAYRSDFRTNVEAMVRQYLFAPQTDTELVDRISREMASFDPDVGVASIEELFKADYRGVLENVDVPVAAINADLYPTNREVMNRYGIDVHVMTGVGHFPMVEAPEAFNATLEQVLTDLLSSN